MGQVYVVSSGTLTGVTLSSGGVMSVFDSGTALDTTVSGGGTQIVFGGGTAVSTTVDSGGALTVSSGGTAVSATLALYGQEYVSAGGVISGNQIISLGYLYVNGGAEYNTYNSGGNDTIMGEGTAAGLAVSTTEVSGDFILSSGGVASDTTITDGNLLVYGGASYNATVTNGYIRVASGLISNTILSGSTSAYVSSGGSVASTTVDQGSLLYVSAGGSETNTFIGKDVHNGVAGTATSTTVSHAFQTISGSSFYALIEGGGQQTVNYDGSATSTTLIDDSKQFDYGVVSDTILLNGGTLDIYGRSVDAVVQSGGVEIITDRTTASGTTLSDGGIAMVSGGVDYLTKVEFGGFETVLSGGFVNGADLMSGGLLVLNSGAAAFGTQLNKGSVLVLAPGAKISGTQGVAAVVIRGIVVETPNSGPQTYAHAIGDVHVTKEGGVFVLDGGTTTSTFNGGEMNVYSGGGAVTTSDGGNMTVFSGGTASLTSVTGVLTVSSGGNELGAIIGSGGLEIVSGTTTYNDVISAGGYERLATYNPDAGAYSGATSGATIAGGTLEVNDGTSVLGAVKFAGSGGVFIDHNQATPTNVFSGFAVGDEIVLPSVPWTASSTVEVTKPGDVFILTNNVAYEVHIAGAKVGETDFQFGSGSVLTRTAPVSMTFLRPAVTAQGGMENWLDAARPVVVAPVRDAAVVEAGARGTGGWMESERVASGFVTVAPVVSHGG